MRKKTTLLLLLAVCLTLPLTGCGRKGSPLPPEGSKFPHKYPYTPKGQPAPGEVSPDSLGTGSDFQPPTEVPPTESFRLSHPEADQPSTKPAPERP